MLMREYDKNTCGYNPHEDTCLWGQGTERNLKIIKAFISWEASSNQNILKTLLKGGRLKEILHLSQFHCSVYHIFL